MTSQGQISNLRFIRHIKCANRNYSDQRPVQQCCQLCFERMFFVKIPNVITFTLHVNLVMMGHGQISNLRFNMHTKCSNRDYSDQI